MSDSITIPLKTLAVDGATIDKLKYWCRLLNIQTRTHNRQAHVTEREADSIKTMISLIRSGMSPAEAARNICPVVTEESKVAVTSPAPAVDLSKIEARFDAMERAFMAVVDELKSVRAENAALRVLLAPPAPIAAPVWKPEPARPDPREGKNIFQRIFLELFQPDKLRRFAS